MTNAAGYTEENRLSTGQQRLASVIAPWITKVSGPAWSTIWKSFPRASASAVWAKFTIICWSFSDSLFNFESLSSDFQRSTFLIYVLVYLDQFADWSM